MEVDNMVYSAQFEGDNPFPLKAQVNLMIDIDIVRENAENGYKYNFLMELPQDLIDMVKQELGENATDEEVKTYLGPFGKIPKKYSNVILLPEDLVKEEIYEENNEVAGLMELNKILIFDKNYNIISEKNFSNGELLATNIYEYNELGKVTSVQKDNQEKVNNVFDSNGKLVKEHSVYGYMVYEYTNDQLTQESEYNPDGKLLNFVEYKYKN